MGILIFCPKRTQKCIDIYPTGTYWSFNYYWWYLIIIFYLFLTNWHLISEIQLVLSTIKAIRRNTNTPHHQPTHTPRTHTHSHLYTGLSTSVLSSLSMVHCLCEANWTLSFLFWKGTDVLNQHSLCPPRTATLKLLCSAHTVHKTIFSLLL